MLLIIDFYFLFLFACGAMLMIEGYDHYQYYKHNKKTKDLAKSWLSLNYIGVFIALAATISTIYVNGISD